MSKSDVATGWSTGNMFNIPTFQTNTGGGGEEGAMKCSSSSAVCSRRLEFVCCSDSSEAACTNPLVEAMARVMTFFS